MWAKRICVFLAILALLPAAALGAQRPDAPRYAQRGPYAVGTRDFTIEDSQRPLNVTVWFPALNPDDQPEATTYRSGLLLSIDGHALRDAEPDAQGAPYPLVVFSHGSSGFRFQSLYFTEHLASYGFVVMAADHPGNTILDTVLRRAEFSRNIAPNYAYRPADVLREIAFAETLTATGSALEGMIDMQRVAITGHSFGGYTALAVGGGRLNLDALGNWCDSNMGDEGFASESFVYTVCFLRSQAKTIAEARGLDTVPQGLWPATSHPHVKAVVAMAPWNGPIFGDGGLDELTAPTMILVGSGDHVTPPERDAYFVYDHLASETKALVTFDHADHYVFVNECWEQALQFGFFDRCSDPVWDMQRVHDLSNHFTTAFLLATLMDDAKAKLALSPDDASFPGVDYSFEG